MWYIFNDSTLSRPGGNVGLHFRSVSERFSSNAKVVGDTIRQVFDLHPQRRAALHIYSHYLTDTWSARRGFCAGNTKTLDTALHKQQTAKLFAQQQTMLHTTSIKGRKQLCIWDKKGFQSKEGLQVCTVSVLSKDTQQPRFRNHTLFPITKNLVRYQHLACY